MKDVAKIIHKHMCNSKGKKVKDKRESILAHAGTKVGKKLEINKKSSTKYQNDNAVLDSSWMENKARGIVESERMYNVSGCGSKAKLMAARA